MSVSHCISSDTDIPLACSYEEVEYEYALWGLILSYFGMTFPKDPFLVVLRSSFLYPALMTFFIVDGAALLLNVAFVHISAR